MEGHGPFLWGRFDLPKRNQEGEMRAEEVGAGSVPYIKMLQSVDPHSNLRTDSRTKEAKGVQV